MSISFDEFMETFHDVQRDLLRDHQAEDGSLLSPCDMMHKDIQLAETRSDELVATAEALGLNIPEDSIDLTEEHTQLHALLMQLKLEMAAAGGTASGLLAAMFAIGRRYGMREAAQMFSSIDTDMEMPS